jgi:hypothetical protein
MPKFFRNFRIKSIELSKVKNYFLYAVGEILLVVAGILIAVYIGEERERIKNEADVEKAITQVVTDLEHDILEIAGVKKSYEERDSLTLLILQNKLKEQDAKKIMQIRHLTTSMMPLTITTLGYEALTKNLSSIPLKNDSLLSLLNNLYINDTEFVKKTWQSLWQEITGNEDYMKDHFDFYSKLQPFDTLLSEREIDFYLHDWHYQNQLNNYNGNANTLVQFATQFEKDALFTLFQIHKAHEKKSESIVRDLCTKFNFDTLRLAPINKDGLYEGVDTLANYRTLKFRILMINNTTAQPVKVWDAYFEKNKTEKDFVMSVPPHTISFYTQIVGWHLYFTDNNDKPKGGLQMGRKNGYVEII